MENCDISLALQFQAHWKPKRKFRVLRRGKLAVLKRVPHQYAFKKYPKITTVPLHFGQVSVMITCCIKKENFFWWEVGKKIFAKHSARKRNCFQTCKFVSCNNDRRNWRYYSCDLLDRSRHKSKASVSICYSMTTWHKRFCSSNNPHSRPQQSRRCRKISYP